jgi:hypothetical protein
MSGRLEIEPEESETGSGRLSFSRTKNRLQGGQMSSSKGTQINIEARMASVISKATKESDMEILRVHAPEAQSDRKF